MMSENKTNSDRLPRSSHFWPIPDPHSYRSQTAIGHRHLLWAGGAADVATQVNAAADVATQVGGAADMATDRQGIPRRKLRLSIHSPCADQTLKPSLSIHSPCTDQTLKPSLRRPKTPNTLHIEQTPVLSLYRPKCTLSPKGDSRTQLQRCLTTQTTHPQTVHKPALYRNTVHSWHHLNIRSTDMNARA